MRKLILIGILFLSLQCFAQDTAKAKQKEYLGVLTLTKKYQDEKNWTSRDEATIGEHFQRLVRYKEQGVVVLAGRTDLPTNDPNMMGLVIFYAKDEKEALQFMMEDPAVKNKIMQVKVHPYGIALSKCE